MRCEGRRSEWNTTLPHWTAGRAANWLFYSGGGGSSLLTFPHLLPRMRIELYDLFTHSNHLGQLMEQFFLADSLSRCILLPNFVTIFMCSSFEHREIILKSLFALFSLSDFTLKFVARTQN
jgi:hypothetical protein